MNIKSLNVWNNLCYETRSKREKIDL